MMPKRIRALLKQIPTATGSIREISLLGVSAIILLSLIGFSFWLSQRAVMDAKIAWELNRFNADLTKFGQSLRTAESSQRGYLLTSDDIFLDPYRQISGELMPLSSLLIVNAPPEILSRPLLMEAQDALRAKLREMQYTIDLASTDRRAGALKRIADKEGLKLTQTIEDIISTLQNETDGLLRANEARSLQWQRIKVWTDAIGAALIMTFAFLSIRLLLRTNTRLTETQAALFFSNTDLENQVAARTVALTRANEEIQRFAYIVSHDLRSPLVNIMGFTSELETLRHELFAKLDEANALVGVETLSKDFDEALGFIKNSIARMERLIAAILRISREGNRPLHPEAVDLNVMVQAIAGSLAHQTKEKAIQVDIKPLPQVFADRLAIEQILSNLIENATKFVKLDGHARIVIDGTATHDKVVLSVSDNGRGIDPRDHQRIFELFRRSGPQTVPGEGMGLAYVTALMRRLGGSIQVKSALGEGSTFTVVLPKVAVAAKRIAA